MARKKSTPPKHTEEALMDAPPVPENRMVTHSMIKVRACGWIGEDGRTYKPGDIFETTYGRRAALGRQVEDVTE